MSESGAIVPLWHRMSTMSSISMALSLVVVLMMKNIPCDSSSVSSIQKLILLVVDEKYYTLRPAPKKMILNETYIIQFIQHLKKSQKVSLNLVTQFISDVRVFAVFADDERKSNPGNPTIMMIFYLAFPRR